MCYSIKTHVIGNISSISRWHCLCIGKQSIMRFFLKYIVGIYGVVPISYQGLVFWLNMF